MVQTIILAVITMRCNWTEEVGCVFLSKKLKVNYVYIVKEIRKNFTSQIVISFFRQIKQVYAYQGGRNDDLSIC